MHEEEDRLLGAGMDQHLVGLDGAVEAADLAPERRAALALGVAEPLLLEGVVSAGLQGQEVGDGHRLAVGAAEEVVDVELVLGEVSLQFEGRDLHSDVSIHRLRLPGEWPKNVFF